MNPVFEPLAGYFGLFRSSWEHAFDQYKKSGLLLEFASHPTQRANLLWTFAVNQFERLTSAMETVKVLPYRQTQHFLLKGEDELWHYLRFKKTDKDGRANNIPTKNNEQYLQLGVFGQGHLETMQVSPQIREQRKYTAGYVAHPNGMDFEFLILSWEAQNVMEELPLNERTNIERLILNNDDDRTAIIEVIGTDENDEQQAGGDRIQQ